MSTTGLKAISLEAPPSSLADGLGAAFERYGFAVVRDHGIDPALIDTACAAMRLFFALPTGVKRAYHRPEISGARGYIPFGIETAKGASLSDLKEFWHVGRDLPPGHPHAGAMPPNFWPGETPEFAPAMRALFAAFETTGARLLTAIAIHLGLPGDFFEDATRDGNSVLRLLHYPPVTGETGALRAEAHEDINAITLLLGAEEAGLQLLTRDGDWLPIAPGPGEIVVNIGDMLARLTNDVLRSTSHRVVNPTAERRGLPRYSMPFFVHFRPDYPIRTLPGCVEATGMDRYPEPITADAYLQERLGEIGLKE